MSSIFSTTMLKTAPEQKLPYEFFDHFLKMCEGYPALTTTDEQGNILGFGMLRAYSPFPTFAKTAEATYFIKPRYTGKGIGEKILDSISCNVIYENLRKLLTAPGA